MPILAPPNPKNPTKQQDTRQFESTETNTIAVQAKLTVGAANDPFEKEADQMANQVMRMPQQLPPVQRKC